MAKQNTRSVSPTAPATLQDHPFYGLRLTDEQKKFQSLIYDPTVKIVFCNSKAGTGKSTIAVCTSILMHEYNLVKDIVYIVHSVGDAQGYLPGTISEKSSVLFEPLYQAIITANMNPEQVITRESMTLRKSGLSFITAITDTYLRGSNVGDTEDGEPYTVMILDEAQNFDEFSLRKTLTRACKNTKVIVIGHDGQVDLRGKSGFTKCLDHFLSKNDPRVGSCELTINHRGFVSQTADESWE